MCCKKNRNETINSKIMSERHLKHKHKMIAIIRSPVLFDLDKKVIDVNAQNNQIISLNNQPFCLNPLDLRLLLFSKLLKSLVSMRSVRWKKVNRIQWHSKNYFENGILKRNRPAFISHLKFYVFTQAVETPFEITKCQKCVEWHENRQGAKETNRVTFWAKSVCLPANGT